MFFMLNIFKEDAQGRNFWERSYKLWMLIPLALTLFSLIYVGIFYSQTGSLFYRDISLTGGTSITVYSPQDISILEKQLKQYFPDVNVRSLSDIATGTQLGFSVETSADSEQVREKIETILGFSLTEENSSTEFTGASLSEGFYKSLMVAMLIAFILMAAVVLIIFKTGIPAIAVIQAVLTDIIVPIAVMNLFQIRISTAGIAAFLMLVGYGVDTNILLTNRVLRKKELSLRQRFSSSLKTGLTMTFTSLFAVLAGYFIAFSPVLKQVFLILSIGLVVDILSTWLGNTAILKWHFDNKEKKKLQT
jgi:preprotein translocase subunit SecF